MFGVPPPPPPPEHFAIGYVYLATGQYYITICHSKQLQEGLMVFSDDFLHFLKTKKKKKLSNSPKLSCGLGYRSRIHLD